MNDFDKINQLLVDNFDGYISYFFPNAKKQGRTWVTGDCKDTPSTKNGSYKISIIKGKGVAKDFATNDKGTDLIGAISAKYGCSPKDGLDKAKLFLNIQDIPNQPSRSPKKTIKKPIELPVKSQQKPELKKIGKEWNQILLGRLKKNTEALEYLYKRSLRLETIEELKLGLSTPYVNKDGVESENALIFPIRNEDGVFLKTNCYYNIPDVTKNPLNSNGWMSGAPQAYFTHPYRGQKAIFVCEGIKDSWVLFQNLKENNLLSDILICSSTHGSSIPDSFKNNAFWAKFDSVYLGHDHDTAGDKIAESLLNHIFNACYRVKCPHTYANPKYDSDGNLKPKTEWGADWTDFFRVDGSIEEFISLVNDAPVCSIEVKTQDIDTNFGQFDINNLEEGREGLIAHDIRNDFINGHMYYPVLTTVTKKQSDKYGNEYIGQSSEIVVVRSDRTVHRVIEMPPVLGMQNSTPILRLSDGVLIDSYPQANSFNTWSWNSISRYLKNESKVRTTEKIFNEILGILKSSVWLPVKEDYVILALTIFVTYVQNVFNAVPIIFMNGPAGSGKSQTGKLLASLSYNGALLGQVSAATIARHVDLSRGFVALDDLEQIQKKSNGSDGFDDLLQALKVSYSKSTAIKMWTDAKTMTVKTLKFYGVKLINNIMGVDDVLATRMLKIQTRKLPDQLKGTLKDLSEEDFLNFERIRQELHVWSFENCRKVKELSLNGYKSDRFDEITLPLKTIAKMVSQDCLDTLETALHKQKVSTIDNDNPVEVLKEVVDGLIKSGFTKFTLIHVASELELFFESNFGIGSKSEIHFWKKHEWISKQLRDLGYLKEDVKLGRVSYFNKRLNLYQFDDQVIENVLKETANTIETVHPLSFCRACTTCQYANNCEYKDLKYSQSERKRIN